MTILLEGASISVAAEPPAGALAQRAIHFASELAQQLGATVTSKAAEPGSPAITLAAVDPDTRLADDDGSCVLLELEPWHTEETLFAHAGIAALLGNPEDLPLTPTANYAAHTIGYALFLGIVALHLRRLRSAPPDTVRVPGAEVLTWVNWKAAVAGEAGFDLRRRGALSEWPVLPCQDGHAALVYTERDWQRLVDWIDDSTLREERFKTFRGRKKHRAETVAVLRDWFAQHSKAELRDGFERHEIPAAPVATVVDLFTDPLLAHRGTITKAANGELTVQPPHRVATEVQAEASAGAPATSPSAQVRSASLSEASSEASSGGLPLSGLRILDFGIITAGAGVSALLADLGAEVLKIESPSRPDPFRGWAGAKEAGAKEDAAVFRSNNRNKRGIALDLKTPGGLRTFLELAKDADVVLENYRRGVLDRLGLSFEALREANPTILLASISGQGLDGPGTGTTTFGSTLEANSGFAALTSYADGLPVISGRNLNYPDQIVCLYGAAVVAAAAVDCRRRGVARHLDVSQRDCAVYQLKDVLQLVADDPSLTRPQLHDALRGVAYSGFVHSTDGRDVAVAARSTDVVNGIDGLDSLERRCLADWAAQRPAEEIVRAFLEAGGGAALVRTGREILAADSSFQSGVLGRSPDGALVKGFPLQFEHHPMTIWGNSPAVGQHNDRFLEPAAPDPS